jgi:hypothetical protein
LAGRAKWAATFRTAVRTRTEKYLVRLRNGEDLSLKITQKL